MDHKHGSRSHVTMRKVSASQQVNRSSAAAEELIFPATSCVLCQIFFFRGNATSDTATIAILKPAFRAELDAPKMATLPR